MDCNDFIVPIITGIFALSGAFVGCYLERKTRHQIRLLEKRSEVFSEFLKILNKCIEDASIYFRKGPEKGSEREQKLIDIYSPALDYINVVRLFLNEYLRNTFEELVRGIYAIHSSKDIGDKRLLTMIQKKKDLQKLLEKQMRNPKW
ncbi:MAG: hypothetical protein ABH952_08075 [Candidatus Omnitrophota bacterium]